MTAALPPHDDDAILAEAARWHVASAHDAMDWDAFTDWLEADPRHAAAYDAIARTDTMVLDNAAALVEETGQVVRPARWRRLVPAGFAAMAAVLALVLLVPHHEPAPRTFVAGAAPLPALLADGSQIMLAPRSRMIIAGDHITLDGEARFAIRHDPARQLTISAGALQITDIGTAFAVATGSVVRVTVDEGRITVRRAGNQLPLGAGQGIIAGPDDTLQAVAAQGLGLGGWRGGAVGYDNTPLTIVAQDIARASGLRIAVDPAAAGRRFSGSISPARGRRAASDLAQIVNLKLIGQGDSVVLGPR